MLFDTIAFSQRTRRLKLRHRSNVASLRVAEVPGVGILSATAVLAAMGGPAAFKSGREFVAWLGLVPRHTRAGGRMRMFTIFKCGDRYLRTLLIHGTLAVLRHGQLPREWVLRLTGRRPPNVAIVAPANKMARWVLLARDQNYQQSFVGYPA